METVVVAVPPVQMVSKPGPSCASANVIDEIAPSHSCGLAQDLIRDASDGRRLSFRLLILSAIGRPFQRSTPQGTPTPELISLNPTHVIGSTISRYCLPPCINSLSSIRSLLFPLPLLWLLHSFPYPQRHVSCGLILHTSFQLPSLWYSLNPTEYASFNHASHRLTPA